MNMQSNEVKLQWQWRCTLLLLYCRVVKPCCMRRARGGRADRGGSRQGAAALAARGGADRGALRLVRRPLRGQHRDRAPSGRLNGHLAGSSAPLPQRQQQQQQDASSTEQADIHVSAGVVPAISAILVL